MKNFISKVMPAFIMAIMCVSLFTSCHAVTPDGDEEAVLIDKPMFWKWFCYSGVEKEPVTTGCTWCWFSTSSETFKIVPMKYDVAFNDIKSNDNTPLDYNTYIILQIKKGHSPELYKNYGLKWFQDNVEPEYRKYMYDEVSKYSPFDLMSNREVAAKIDASVLKRINVYFKHLNDSATFPVICKSVITGRAQPNLEQLKEMNKTAAAIQAKQTQDRTTEMQNARERAENARAKADKAYMKEMNLSANQFIQLKYIEMIANKPGANIDVLVGGGESPMWNIRR